MKHFMYAIGHNNVNGLVALHLASPPLFESYSGLGIALITTWADYESRELDGDRRYRKIGRAFAEITFPFLTYKELAFIEDDMLDGEEDALMTIRILRKRHYDWQNFNATMIFPELASTQDDGRGWRDVKLELRDLELIE